MNREDIIRMAREAGIEHLPDNWGDGWWQADSTQSLERFAQAAYAVGAAAEREACAKVCEELKYTGFRYVPEAPKLAARIRARGEK